jgi:hypothetical protein
MFQRQKIVWSAFPLSMYIPLLLACAVIFPLLITIISSEVLARPALITQSSAVMETDAQARIQLIDAYFVERLKDIQTVSQFTPVQQFLLGSPARQKQSFQAAGYSSLVVPWTYIILKPLNQVTSIADQRLRSTILIGIIVLLLALLAGLTTARRITRPILRSVTFLLGSSQLLKTFSNQEYVIVQEQSWMVEASRLGLQSVRYYTHANSVAAAKLQEICDELLNGSGYLDAAQVRLR